MLIRGLLAVLGVLSVSAQCLPATPSDAGVPVYEENHLILPSHYREWIYLSTGFDMSYSPAAPADHHQFDNVFVEPAAYRSFLETGTWPDKTVLVLEVRGARDKGSINQHGHYQDAEVMGLEVHVKDAARFEGGWAFFEFDGTTRGTLVPKTESCYSCHAEHAAVDTTFVQFYPTLMPVATAKGTLSKSYRP